MPKDRQTDRNTHISRHTGCFTVPTCFLIVIIIIIISTLASFYWVLIEYQTHAYTAAPSPLKKLKVTSFDWWGNDRREEISNQDSTSTLYKKTKYTMVYCKTVRCLFSPHRRNPRSYKATHLLVGLLQSGRSEFGSPFCHFWAKKLI